MSLVLLGILNSQAAAAGGAGAYDLLETQVLASSAASVTFTGLGSYTDYKHLQIRAVTRSARTAFDIDVPQIRFNSDTGANYAHHQIHGDGSSVSSSSSVPDFQMQIGFTVGSNTANAFGGLVTDILDFSSTAKNTTIRTMSGMLGTGYTRVQMRSGLYNSTSAITSLEIFNAFDNFVAGSRFSLYGIKGA